MRARSDRAIGAFLFSGCLLCGPANAYPTGAMTCKDIGEFASAVVVGKKNEQTMREALAKVNKATADRAVERKNMTGIVRAIYVEAWAKNLSEAGAGAAFTADCEAQK
jgi:hypothetical protein